MSVYEQQKRGAENWGGCLGLYPKADAESSRLPAAGQLFGPSAGWLPGSG